MSKKNELDQYYTNPYVAKKLVRGVSKSKYFIEPSAGSGAFLDALKNRKILAFDISPKVPGIIKKDFFAVDWEDYDLPLPKDIIVITNPPFGKNASLAVKFFNKCAEISNDIRFIVPKTFRKQSIQNRLNLHFHLIKDIDLPFNSFILKGKPYDVPCCFQIWKWKKTRRRVSIFTKSKHFIFVKKDQGPTVAIRRVGGKAGQILEGLNHSESSTYFIKITDEKLRKSIMKLNLIETRDNTAGVRSVSKKELTNALEGLLK